MPFCSRASAGACWSGRSSRGLADSLISAPLTRLPIDTNVCDLCSPNSKRPRLGCRTGRQRLEARSPATTRGRTRCVPHRTAGSASSSLLSLRIKDNEEFYTEAPLADQLLSARRKIANFSLPRTQRRLKQQRTEASLPVTRILDTRKPLYKSLKVRVFSKGACSSCAVSDAETIFPASVLQTTQILGSQIGDTRPIANVRFSPDSSLVATGSWSGNAKVWSVPNLNETNVFKGELFSIFFSVDCFDTPRRD